MTKVQISAIQEIAVAEMEFVIVSQYITFICVIQYSGESL